MQVSKSDMYSFMKHCLPNINARFLKESGKQAGLDQKALEENIQVDLVADNSMVSKISSYFMKKVEQKNQGGYGRFVKMVSLLDDGVVGTDKLIEVFDVLVKSPTRLQVIDPNQNDLEIV